MWSFLKRENSEKKTLQMWSFPEKEKTWTYFTSNVKVPEKENVRKEITANVNSWKGKLLNRIDIIYEYMIVPGKGKNLYKNQLFLWKKETKTFQGNASNRPNGQNIFKIINIIARSKQNKAV